MSRLARSLSLIIKLDEYRNLNESKDNFYTSIKKKQQITNSNDDNRTFDLN